MGAKSHLRIYFCLPSSRLNLSNIHNTSSCSPVHVVLYFQTTIATIVNNIFIIYRILCTYLFLDCTLSHACFFFYISLILSPFRLFLSCLCSTLPSVSFSFLSFLPLFSLTSVSLSICFLLLRAPFSLLRLPLPFFHPDLAFVPSFLAGSRLLRELVPFNNYLGAPLMCRLLDL